MKQADGHNTFSEVFYALSSLQPAAVIISAISLGLLILFEQPFIKRIAALRFLPGALFVVVTGIFLNFVLNQLKPQWGLTSEHLVQLPVAGSAAQFLGFFRLPDFSALTNPQVYVVAATLALVASLETLLCVEATDNLDPHKRTTPVNRELKAQGIGNMLAGLIGGLPVTQVIVRSSANINAGGRTKIASIVHGGMLLLAACLFPRLINLIPLASLAAILLVVGYKLSKPALYRSMFRLGYEQFIPFIATVTAILLTDLLKGIACGIVVAIFFILRKNYKHSFHFKKERKQETEIITLRLSEEVTFLNKASIQETLRAIPRGARVIIDGLNSIHIDHDVLEVIHDFKANNAPLRNISVETMGIREVVLSHH